MKKKLNTFLIISSVLVVNMFLPNVSFAEYDYRHPIPEERGFKKPPISKDVKNSQKRPPSREDFEKRLNLTQEQKNIAKAQREKSIAKIKPLIDEINAKKLKMEKLNPETDSQLLNQLENEVRALRKQCHEIRKENMKAFEASLTDVQKREMQKMKEEGRRRFEREHKKMTK